MRPCGQQAAAAALTSRHSILTVPVPVFPVPVCTTSAGFSGSSSLHSVARAPRSPPTSPRQTVDPADPELVRQLRAYLLRASQRPAGITDELGQLLQSKLAVSTQQLEDLFSSSSLSDASKSSQLQQPQQLQELESGLTHMLQLFSAAEVFHLLQQQPGLLFVPLASWFEFFVGYGFSSSQIKNLISQTPEVMTQGTLVTAGDAIMHLKALGFDNDEIRHRVVASYPQVLAMTTRDIDVLIRLWDKFKFGVDEQGPC